MFVHREKDFAKVEKVHDLLERARKAFENRNVFIHGFVGTGDNGLSYLITKVSEKKWVSYSLRPTSTDQVWEQMNEAAEVERALTYCYIEWLEPFLEVVEQSPGHSQSNAGVDK